MKFKYLVVCLGFWGIVLSSSTCATNNRSNEMSLDDQKVVGINPDYFLTNSDHLSITLIDCNLANGSKVKCYKLVSASIPSDHQMGPWCPKNINDGADKGGIWIESGKVYDVDGSFIKNMSSFYSDDKWKMYDETGTVYATRTKEQCAAAARPDVDPKYHNHCVECLPSYVSDITNTYLIPAVPQLLAEIPENKYREPRLRKGPQEKDRPKRPNGPPPGGGNMGAKGIAFNGVRYDAPAPTNAILNAYTLAPFDDAGGHINLHAGYHYHAVTGKTKEIAQKDGHAPLIGYAMDGVPMFAHLDKDGNEAVGLDACRGHSDEIRGYHYHVGAPGSNSIIDCHRGVLAID